MATNKRRPRIYYCGMVNTVGYSQRVGLSLFVGAASNKMTGLVRGMRAVGANAWLVSIPVLGQSSCKRFARGLVAREDFGANVFLATFANRWLRKLFAPMVFARFCAECVQLEDRVVLYNHALEYLPGLLVLKMRGVRVFLDIEDAPRDDEIGAFALLQRQVFRLSFWLTESKKITVSRELANRLSIRNACVVYGATRKQACQDLADLKWQQIRRGTPLRIHFGGSLSRDTGLSLFCDAVRLLAATLPEDTEGICFHVTGSGGEAELADLKNALKGSHVQIVWQRDLSREEFQSVFSACHASLSLKLPGAAMVRTTFPSKVVEITGSGLLLIATRASDVPMLFDETNAVLLEYPVAHELADRIVRILNDLEGMRIRAARGQVRALELFDERIVGERLVNFLGVAATAGRTGKTGRPNA